MLFPARVVWSLIEVPYEYLGSHRDTVDHNVHASHDIGLGTGRSSKIDNTRCRILYSAQLSCYGALQADLGENPC